MNHDMRTRAHANAPWLYELLSTAVELFECGDEANLPGTDSYTWLQQSRIVLARINGMPTGESQ